LERKIEKNEGRRYCKKKVLQEDGVQEDGVQEDGVQEDRAAVGVLER
jgi:hypothetical protein